MKEKKKIGSGEVWYGGKIYMPEGKRENIFGVSNGGGLWNSRKPVGCVARGLYHPGYRGISFSDRYKKDLSSPPPNDLEPEQIYFEE